MTGHQLDSVMLHRYGMPEQETGIAQTLVHKHSPIFPVPVVPRQNVCAGWPIDAAYPQPKPFSIL